MKLKLILQLHIHSDRSHDSFVSIKNYVRHLEKIISENEYAVLGITDHKIIPIKTEDALKLSTKKIIVIPGIQWKIYKTLSQSIKKLCTRRELLTLGCHDNFKKYIVKKVQYEISEKEEILSNPSEEEFLDYISKNKEIILIVPHPKHFFVDYYGHKEIAELKQKINNKKISIPFFVEEKTGYDPFPRIFVSYRNKYPIVGGSDAHEIYSFLGTNSLCSVETSIECDKELIDIWEKAIVKKDINLYKKTIKNIFNILIERNDEIQIKKHYLRACIHFFHSVPSWFKRRFSDFPRNLTR